MFPKPAQTNQKWLSPNTSQLHNPAYKKKAEKSFNSKQSSFLLFAIFQLLSLSGQIMQKMLPVNFLMLVNIWRKKGSRETL